MGAMGGAYPLLSLFSRVPAQLCPLGRSTEVRNLEVMLLHEPLPTVSQGLFGRPILTSYRFITDFFGLSCERITKCITECNPPPDGPHIRGSL